MECTQVLFPRTPSQLGGMSIKQIKIQIKKIENSKQKIEIKKLN